MRLPLYFKWYLHSNFLGKRNEQFIKKIFQVGMFFYNDESRTKFSNGKEKWKSTKIFIPFLILLCKDCSSKNLICESATYSLFAVQFYPATCSRNHDCCKVYYESLNSNVIYASSSTQLQRYLCQLQYSTPMLSMPTPMLNFNVIYVCQLQYSTPMLYMPTLILNSNT